MVKNGIKDLDMTQKNYKISKKRKKNNNKKKYCI